MLARLLHRVTCSARVTVQALRRRLLAATKPPAAPLVAGTLADLLRGKPELVAENALLRQQLVVLKRSVRRPRCTPADRALLVLLASRLRTWRQALLLVQPDTLLRWHRQLALRLVGGLGPYWELRGYFDEGRRSLGASESGDRSRCAELDLP